MSVTYQPGRDAGSNMDMRSASDQGSGSSERLNRLTHLAGVIASFIGTIALVWIALREGDGWKLAGYCIYGASLMLLYLASTLYHTFEGRAKRVFKKIDHVAIYLLIAGSYTPFLLGVLRETVGWPVFVMVWTLALAGIIIEFLPGHPERTVSLFLYLGMGWFAVTLAGPMLEALTMEGFGWILAGGLLYTSGTVFYVLDHRHRYNHGIWHLFVLGGSASHFYAIAGFA